MRLLNNRLKTILLLPIMIASSLSTLPAYAKKDTMEDSWYVRINSTPTFYVKSNGQQYTGLSEQKHPSAFWNIPARFTFEPGSNDRIKSYGLQLRLKWETAGQSEKFTGSVVRKNFNRKRPKKVDTEIAFPLNGNNIEQFVVNACNATAAGFRNIGQSNDLIFSRVHNVSAKIYASHAIDTQPVPPASFVSSGAHGLDKYAKIVCMKAPAPTVDTAQDLQTSSGVTDASLNIIEQSTLGGSCKVNLSTVIKTNLPNTEVKYRYEHTNGNKSDIKTVTTSHSKTAMDAHWYDVPLNPNGAEAGSVRIIGVSHNFQSAWKNYNMTCNEGVSNNVSLVTKPTVQLTLEPAHKVMHKGMLCPTKVKVTATLKSKKAFSGSGVVSIKNGSFGFATHEVNLSPNITWRYYETLDLKPWGTINASSGLAGGSNTWQSQPGTSTAAPSQRFEIRYSLTANQQNVILTPYKTINVSCTEPKVNQRLLPSNNGLKAPDAPQQKRPQQLQLKQQEIKKLKLAPSRTNQK
jgi:K+-transporting ATPase c subunit